MKKETSYSNQEISYWPYYSYGKIGIVYVVASTALAVVCFIWDWIDHSMSPFAWVYIAIIFITIALSVLLLWCLWRVMNQKVSVSISGVTISNSVAQICEEIPWECVSSVYFRKDNWYGVRSIEILLNNPIFNKRRHLSGKTVYLPINEAVDPERIVGLIPKDLMRNDPNTIH